MSRKMLQPDPAAPTFSSAIADAHNYIEWIIATLQPYLAAACLKWALGTAATTNI